jgi:coenzyme F420-reducing hydrogenase delta subunit
VEYTQKILDEVGVGGERLAMYNMSAAQGARFVEVANEMTEKIKQLGPSPIKKQKHQEPEIRKQESAVSSQQSEG